MNKGSTMYPLDYSFGKVYDDDINNRRMRMMRARMSGKYYYYALYQMSRA